MVKAEEKLKTVVSEPTYESCGQLDLAGGSFFDFFSAGICPLERRPKPRCSPYLMEGGQTKYLAGKLPGRGQFVANPNKLLA